MMGAKFIPLMWAILWRKKLRTGLTFASIVVAFVLFGMLQGVNTGFKKTISDSSVNRLLVANSVSLTESLPYAYMQRIESLPNITKVSPMTWFAAYYQDPKNEVGTFPVDIDRELAVFPEEKIPAAQVDAMRQDRLGAIVGKSMAVKYGWKIGDRIPLHAEYWVKRNGSSDWEFNIVGIFENAADRGDEDTFYINYAYFDEERAYRNGTVGWYVVTDDNPGATTRIAASIDKLFANSADETRTQTEKEFRQAFVKQVGDINTIVSYILVAVFFALLFATGTTMLQSVRDRVPELAILKSLGFTDRAVLILVLSETLLLCVTAAGMGLLLAYFIFPLLKESLGMVDMPLLVVGEGLALAAVVGVLTGAIPAWRARNLQIVEALRA